MNNDAATIPVVDIAPLLRGDDAAPVAAAIGQACRTQGFFYIVGHGIPEALPRRVDTLSRTFFALDLETKMRIRMARGGPAWRGFFPVGGELTLGRPDQKEGLYFGEELPPDDPRTGSPLHGCNLFPDEPPALRDAVLEYMAAMTQLGHFLMAGLALSLELPRSYFADRYTRDPLLLFRVFHYPPLAASAPDAWSVGEHTDYGVLTMLHQDDAGGLEVKVDDRWITAPPLPGSLVCNIGDMLDAMTGGRYRSTPHRVRNRSGRSRISLPFFFDPAFDAPVRPIFPDAPGPEDRSERWDGVSVRDLRGTYGDYLLAKVSKVFPQLGDDVL